MCIFATPKVKPGAQDSPCASGSSESQTKSRRSGKHMFDAYPAHIHFIIEDVDRWPAILPSETRIAAPRHQISSSRM